MRPCVYPNYHRRTIERFARGLKLGLGGTWPGKTSSLAELLREGNYPAEVKSIYVTKPSCGVAAKRRQVGSIGDF